VRTRQLLFIVAIPFCVVSLGTVGYWVIEEWPFLDALYMSVITLTTVGYMEVHPLDQAGRIFTMVFVLGGVFTLFYAATEVVRAVVSGEIATVFGRQRMQWSLADMKDHLVVCGFGRMGRLVCEQFSAQGLPFVVVEREAALLKDFQMPNGIPLTGDATSDDVLRQAGVERARGSSPRPPPTPTTSTSR